MYRSAPHVYKAIFTIAGLLLGCLLLSYVCVVSIESLNKISYREVEGLRIADHPDAASTLRLTFELDSAIKESSTTTISYPICDGFDWIRVHSAGVAYEVTRNGDGGCRLVLSCVSIDLSQPVIVDVHYPLNDILVNNVPIGCAVNGEIGLAGANLTDPRLAEIIRSAEIHDEGDIVTWMRGNIESIETSNLPPPGSGEIFDDYDPYHLQDVSDTLDSGKADCKARIALFCGFLRELNPSAEFEMILFYPQGYETRLGDPESPWTHVLVRVKKGEQYLIFDPILDAQYSSADKKFLGIPLTGPLRGDGHTILTAGPAVPAGPYLVEITVLDPEIELQAVKIAVLQSSTAE